MRKIVVLIIALCFYVHHAYANEVRSSVEDGKTVYIVTHEGIEYHIGEENITVYDCRDLENSPSLSQNVTADIELQYSDNVQSSSLNMSSLNVNTIYPSLIVTASYKLNSVSIEDGTEISIASEDTLLASYTVQNNGDTEQNLTLLICIYDNTGKLIIFTSVNDTVSPGTLKDLTGNVTVPAGTSACYAKVMLWDSLTGLLPLHDIKQIGDDSSAISTANVECQLNEEYNLVISAENVSANYGTTHTLKYNPSDLQVIDLCSFTYIADLAVGQILDTDINIISFDESKGEIVFSNNNAPASLKKVLNSVKFKSLKSETTSTIIIE